MKDCPEITELIHKFIGDEVVGFFERKLITSTQEVRVYVPVYSNVTQSKDFVN